MKNWLWKGIVAAAIALPALSGIARAEGCTKATLNGAYAFSVVDFATPFVVVGIGHFDGNGGFSQADYRGDSLRTMGARDFARGETGSYTVNPDCTGTQLIHLNVPLPPGAPFGASHGEIENRFVISNGGRRRQRHSSWTDTSSAHSDARRFLEGRVGTGQLSV